MSLNDFNVTNAVKEIKLYPEGSYQDLALRGFSREYILAETGHDVGYHNSKLHELSNVNRDAYRARYVAEHKDREFIDKLLHEISIGNNGVKFVCDSCGLGVPSKYFLYTLFDGLGLHDEYLAVRGQGQKAVMQRGCIDKFGTDNVFKLQEYQDIAAETRERKYGAKYTLQRGSTLADGAWATFKEHMQDPDFAIDLATRKFEGRKRNGTLNSSGPEREFYKMLCNHFDKDDIEQQYKDKIRYPWFCDFYIKSRDMFIELNCHWIHGFHWYNGFSKRDMDRRLWIWSNYYRCTRIAKRYGLQYGDVINTWMGSDCSKRYMALAHKLNYVVFWDNDLKDAQVWFDHGCPDAHDYDYEYSWLYESDSVAPFAYRLADDYSWWFDSDFYILQEEEAYDRYLGGEA